MHSLEHILTIKGRDIRVIAPDATVLEAADEMCGAHVGALLVMDDDRLVGIFSERDLMKRVVLARRDPARTRIDEVMTRDVACVSPAVSPHDAMALITHRRIRHLPVVDGKRVVGVVSIGDLVRWTLLEREHDIEMLEDYVSGRYPA